MRVSHFAISAPMLALALAFAPVATADEDGVARIPVAASDLTDDAAVAALHARVIDAAAEVCADATFTSSPFYGTVVRRCRERTADAAIAESGLAPLIAYHAATRQTRVAPTETLALR